MKKKKLTTLPNSFHAYPQHLQYRCHSDICSQHRFPCHDHSVPNNRPLEFVPFRPLWSSLDILAGPADVLGHYQDNAE